MADVKKPTTRSGIIAQKKKDEQAKRLASFPELNPNPVLEVDVSGGITFANPAAHQTLERLGLDPAQVDAFLPSDIAPILKEWDKKSAFSLDREIHLQGKVFGEAITLVPEFQVARIYAYDITERKEAEQRILQLNQELSQRARDLQVANEELEVTNEELRVANEDLAQEIDRRKEAEELAHARAEALRVGEERFRFVLSNSPVVVANLDRELRYTWIHNLLPGFKREDILGRTVGLATTPAAQEQMLKLLQNVVSHGSSAQCEITVQAVDGDRIFESHAEPLRDAQGEITGVAMLSMDITQRKRTEEALREAEQTANDLIRYAPTAIYEIDFRGPRFRHVNDAMCQMLGYTREELLAMSPFALLDEDSQKRFAERIRKTFAGEPIDEWVEYKAIRKDGGEIYAVLQTRFLQEDGKPIGAFVIAHDISERKRAETTLQAHRQLLETVVNHVPAAVNIIRGSDLTLELINPAYQAIAPGKEMVGKTLDDLWAETGRSFGELCRQVLATGEPHQVQDELFTIRRRPDGPLEPAYFSWSLHRVRLPGDEGWGILNTAWETTGRKQIELQLKDIAEKFSSLFDTTSDGVWIHNLKGEILEVNDAYCRMSGYSRDELTHMPISSLEAVESPEDIAQHIRKVLEAGGHDRFESRHRRKDGSIFDVDITALYLEREGGQIAIFVRDITERKRAEEALLSSEQRLRMLSELVEEGIVIHDRGNILEGNESLAKMFGFDHAEEMLGRSGLDLMTSQTRELFREHLATGSTEPYEGTGIRKDGTRFPVEIHPSRIVYKGRSVRTGIIYDLTERKRAESALRESEERFRTMADGSPEILWVTNAEGSLQFVNRAHREFFGVSLEEVEGAKWEPLVHPDDAADYIASFRRCVEAQAHFTAEARVRRADGEWRWIASHAEPRFSPAGEFMGHVGLSPDITERKRAEEALRESEERFRVAQELSPDGFSILRPVRDPQGRVVDLTWVYANAATERTVGMTFSRMAGKSLLELFPGHRGSTILEAYQQVAETGESCIRESLYPGDDFLGQRWFRIAVVSMGKDIAVSSQDITERKQVEAALLESEGRYRSLFDHMLDGFAYCQMLFDEQGHPVDFIYLGVNAAFEALTGLKDVTGKRITEVIPGIREQQPELFEIYDRVAQSGRPERLVLYFKPLAMWVSLSVHSPAKGYFVAVFDNITERKRAEEELRQRTEELQTIMEAVPTAVFITRDPDARTITGNRAARELVELPPNANISKSAPEEERPTGWQEMRNGVLIAPEDLPLQQAARGEEVRDYEMDLVFEDGTVKSVSGSATPLRDESGQPQGSVAVLIDVTQRKLADEHIRQLNETMEQRANELEVANEELERLATSLALDLRSPLVSLRGVSRVLAQDYGAQLPPQAQELFHLIQANAEEMEVLTQGLLQLMHVTRQTLRKQEVKPAEIVRAALAELQPQRTGHPAEIHVGPLPACSADPLLLKQVWVNLLSNALKATRHKEQAHIEVGARAEGDRTVYFVKDNGVGFDMSYAGTIFHAFQSYHRPEEWGGSKVGLAIVDSIIRRHGGRVWAEGAIDQGATFSFEV